MIQYGSNSAKIRVLGRFAGMEVLPLVQEQDVVNDDTEFPFPHSVNNISQKKLWVDCELGAGVYTSSGGWDNPGLLTPGQSSSRNGWLVFDGDDTGTFTIVATYKAYDVDDNNKTGDAIETETFTMTVNISEAVIIDPVPTAANIKVKCYWENLQAPFNVDGGTGYAGWGYGGGDVWHAGLVGAPYYEFFLQKFGYNDWRFRTKKDDLPHDPDSGFITGVPFTWVFNGSTWEPQGTWIWTTDTWRITWWFGPTAW